MVKGKEKITKMKVYVTTNHDSHYPVGAASVVVAENEQQARELLDEELEVSGLQTSKSHKYLLTELPLDKPSAQILVDGDY